MSPTSSEQPAGSPARSTSSTEASCYADFFRTTLAPLRRYVARMVGCEAEAKDIVQDAQARVHAVMQRQEVAHPHALLYTTARHLAIDELKHRARSPFRDEPAAEESAPCGLPSVEDTVMAREEWTLLQQAIAGLTQECRDVLLLRTVEGLSHEEISRRLSVPRKTVEKRLYRAVRLLHAARQAHDGNGHSLVPMPSHRRTAAN